MMTTLVITIIISLVITTLFGHVIHWALHQSWSGKVHQSHMTHHLKLYPSTDFVSLKYRSAGKDSTPKFFFVAALPLILAPIILYFCGVVSLIIMITILLVEGLMGFLHDYLHDAFHIKNHWLSNLPAIKHWFARLITLHYQHHINMQSNFGIFSFIWDRILGTFRNAKV